MCTALQSMVLDERRLGEYLGPILKHTYTLPQVQVQKSLVYAGSNFRLRELVHDMIVSKRSVKVGAIGGSITHGAKASVIGVTRLVQSSRPVHEVRHFPEPASPCASGALPGNPQCFENEHVP